MTRTIRSLNLIVVAGALLMASCGSSSSEPNSATDPGDEPSTEAASPGGTGQWTAAQLCTLSEEAPISALFNGADVAEQPGIDDPDHSACIWKDPNIDPLEPESSLVAASSRSYDGSGFSDTAETRDLAGADEAVFFEDFDGSDASYIATFGDFSLSVEFEVGTPGGLEVAEAMAEQWIAGQTAG